MALIKHSYNSVESTRSEGGSAGESEGWEFEQDTGKLSPTENSVYAQPSHQPNSQLAQPGSSSSNLGQINAGQGPMVRPPVLVECPSCETKFTVSRAAISTTDAPVFHCSKCDSVFSKPACDLVEVAVKPAPIQTRSLMQPTASFSPLSDPLTPRPLASGPLAPRTLAPGPLAPGSSRDYSERQLPLSFDGSLARQQNEFASRSVTLKDLGEVRSTPLSDAPFSDPRFSGTGFSNTGDQSTGLSFRRLASAFTSATGVSGPGAAYSGLSGIPELSRNVARQLPILALAAPIVLCLLLLAVTSWISIVVPSLGGWMSDTFVARTEANYGRGLVLRGVKYSKVTLENGTQMGVIAGSVYNGSGASIERATIEGIVFGRGGEELVRVKNSLGNKLNQAKLSTLTADMIQDMQSDRRTRNVTVRPGEGYPFVLATSLQPGARSFSARILNAR